jgi:hypothetical protein
LGKFGEEKFYPCQESNPLNYGFWLPMTLGYAVGLGDPSVPNEQTASSSTFAEFFFQASTAMPQPYIPL